MISDPCGSCGGQGVKQVRKKLRINIPAGVDTGTRLRVTGEGNAGPRGGPSGDLYVFLTVRNHPRLQRDGLNIFSEVMVSYLQAILGDTIEVETVDGSKSWTSPLEPSLARCSPCRTWAFPSSGIRWHGVISA